MNTKKDDKRDPRIKSQTPGEQVDHYSDPTEAAVKQETESRSGKSGGRPAHYPQITGI